MRNIFFVLFIIVVFSQTSCAQISGKKPQKVEDVFIPEGDGVRVQVWVENLQIPWSFIFFTDGRTLVRERPGK